MKVTSDLDIPEDELTFTASRSGGAGGQNVNKVNTRVTLLFDVSNSPSLTEQQRQRLLTRLATRINKEGVLRVVSQQHRTQGANRRAAEQLFAELLADALKQRRRRQKTRVPRSAKLRRLERKTQRGQLKRSRGKVRLGE